MTSQSPGHRPALPLNDDHSSNTTEAISPWVHIRLGGGCGIFDSCSGKNHPRSSLASAPTHPGAGSRRLFGVILESKVCILLDTSGSMGPYLQQVKTELTLLIWEQLRKHCDR